MSNLPDLSAGLANDFLTFLSNGGAVMWAILVVSLSMWTLIAERYLFFWKRLPGLRADVMERLRSRRDERPEAMRQYGRSLLAGYRALMQQHLLPIQTMTAMLPLLGLLGTVTGMIKTFDVITVFGTGNVRGMASGISEALLTTMAGLVTALSGLVFSADLDTRARAEEERMARRMGRAAPEARR